MPGILDVLSGRVERLPAMVYRLQLEAARRAMQAEPDNFEHAHRAAEAHDMLGEQREGLRLLDGFPPDQLSVAQRALRDGLKARLLLHKWLAESGASQGLAEQAQIAFNTAPANALMARILEWANRRPAVAADEMLPDYFGLRLAPNKTALTDNEQLKNMGLAGAPQFLVWLIGLHPVWENVDTFHALSLALAVAGKQHLAHFARLRVHELLEQGRNSRVQIPPDVRDVRALLIPRNLRTGVLAEIPTLSDDTKKRIAAEFASHREFARRWHAAREAFALKKLDEGKSPDTDAAFWQDFVYAPPAAAAAAVPEPEHHTSDTKLTLVVAAAAAALATLLAMAVMRRRGREKT